MEIRHETINEKMSELLEEKKRLFVPALKRLVKT